MRRQMEIADYQRAAQRTSPDDGHDRLHNAELGLIGEAGEIVDVLKKQLFQGLDPARAREMMIDELGDVLWYIAEGCAGLGRDIAALHRLTIEIGVARISEDADLEEAAVRLASWAASAHAIITKYGDRERVAVAWRELRTVYRRALDLAVLLGVGIEEVMAGNIDKLKARYPEKFDAAISSARYEGGGENGDQ